MSERDELMADLARLSANGRTSEVRAIACAACNLLERDGAELARLRERIAELERGEILTYKELMSAIVTAVMSGVQSDRNEALRKVQRHIIRVEKERDDLETQCEHMSDHRALAERRVIELEAEVKRLLEQRDGPLYRCPQCDHLRLELGEARAALARVEAAEKAIERVLPAKAREHIDCWKVNYGLDRYDKVTAARRWAEAGGPSDGPIMALATAIEWLEST